MGLGFSISPGLGTALSNRNDDRAYFTFGGDLNQMGLIERFLRDRDFPVAKCGVYPGFLKADGAEYARALKLIFVARIEGWWNQEHDLIARGICTQEEFDEALGR